MFRSILRFLTGKHGFHSSRYWEDRYRAKGNSGAGSYGVFAEYKAEVINKIVAEKGVRSVIEIGCGDGNQASKLNVGKYLGVDVSKTAIARCKDIFRGDATRRFVHLSNLKKQTADLTMSLDVIYHLVEDEVFEAHMRLLFERADAYVLIYSTNIDKQEGLGRHVRHRRFTEWIEQHIPGVVLVETIKNQLPAEAFSPGDLPADFFLYRIEKK